jgi:hypothetical protein
MPESDLVMRAREDVIRGHKRIDQRRKYAQQPDDVHLQAAAKRVTKELESQRNNLTRSEDIVRHDWPQIACLAQRIQAMEARQRHRPVSGRGFGS